MRIISDIFYSFFCTYYLYVERLFRIYFDEKLWIDLVESDIISILFAIAMKNHTIWIYLYALKVLGGFTNQIVGLHYVKEG